MSHNGWTNYETWCVNLWLTNDAASDQAIRDLAAECWTEAEADKTFSRLEKAKIDLAQRLKDLVEEGNPLSGDASVYCDLLNAALGEVDWMEIAEHYLAEVEEGGGDEP